MGLSLASETDRFAVGFPGADSLTTATVRVYRYDIPTKTFVQVGNVPNFPDTPGELDEYEAGRALGLVSSGNIMFVGVPSQTMALSAKAGSVHALDLIGASWDAVGPFEYDSPYTANALYGSSVSVSDLGDTNKWYVAEGMPGNGGGDTPGIYVSGHNSTTGDWESNIGEATSDAALKGTSTSAFGSSVSIANENSGAIFVAVGAPGQSGADNSYFTVIKGVISTTTWTPVFTSPIITGTLGTSVAISSDSTVVVAGDPTNGRVYVYYQAGGDTTWAQLGGNIAGAVSDMTEFGTAVAIARNASNSVLDGITIAVGEPGYNAPGRPSTGRVCVLEYAGGTWRSVLKPIVGLSENERFGETLAMNPDGTWFVAAGARSIGRVAVYGTSHLDE
jgi:hypothetical protein